MKIVEAKLRRPKAAEIREVCNKICNDFNRAAYFEFYHDVKYFDNIARRNGFKTIVRKRLKYGYDVWVRK